MFLTFDPYVSNIPETPPEAILRGVKHYLAYNKYKYVQIEVIKHIHYVSNYKILTCLLMPRSSLVPSGTAPATPRTPA